MRTAPVLAAWPIVDASPRGLLAGSMPIAGHHAEAEIELTAAA